MRILCFALMILGYAPLLQADNLLQNGDFTDGKNHWSGDGKTPDEYAQDNSSATSDPLTSKGLIIQLKEHSWTKICQDFKGDKGTHYVFNVTYMLSPDFTLSDKADDYVDVGKHANIGDAKKWLPITIGVGQFFDTVEELDGTNSFYEKFTPKLGSSEIQTYQDVGPPLSSLGHKLVALAFPPGTGFIVLLNISVTSDYKPPSSE
jgi:hypothetical protein